jgi:hypothetical protein
MHQMTVDIDQRGAVGFLPHHVCFPEFVVKSLRFHDISLAHVISLAGTRFLERAIMPQRAQLGSLQAKPRIGR